MPEPFWNLYRCTRMRCYGNLLIHWSAVVTILHSGMITPHWDLDLGSQLKVVSVKLTYALLGYVSCNGKLTVDWYTKCHLFRWHAPLSSFDSDPICKTAFLGHHKCISTFTWTVIRNTLITSDKELLNNVMAYSWVLIQSICQPPWCQCDLFLLATEIGDVRLFMQEKKELLGQEPSSRNTSWLAVHICALKLFSAFLNQQNKS